jgi:SAM-dependent methyltransferase
MLQFKGDKKMRADQRKWDKRYRERNLPDGDKPNSFLKKCIRRLGQGKALDIAAGDGRNALFLAQHGWDVEAVDISEVGLKKAQTLARKKRVNIKTIRADLDSYNIKENQYDLIANFYFLDRRLIPGIKRGLKRGGRVIFETYLLDHGAQKLGAPENRKYLLKPNELLTRFSKFRILFYREGIINEGGKKRTIASLLAQKTN